MRPDREMALEAMRNLGWHTKRIEMGGKPAWEFTRPDTGGLFDVVRCRQSSLSMTFVADKAMQYDDAPGLVREIQEAKERWLKGRFLGIYSRAQEAAE